MQHLVQPVEVERMRPGKYEEGVSGSCKMRISRIDTSRWRPQSRRVGLLIGLLILLVLIACAGAGLQNAMQLSGAQDTGRSGPLPPYILYGYTCGVIGTRLGGCQINLTNTVTNDSMLLESDVQGYYQCDLANMIQGYSDGDLIIIQATYQASSGENQTYVTGTGGKWFNVTIIDIIPEFPNVALPALAVMGMLLVLAVETKRKTAKRL